jgi:hypothetical protein
MLLILLVATTGTCASAQVYRCADSKGRTIYSDFPCDRQGAIPAGPSIRGGTAAPFATWNGRSGQAITALIAAATKEADPAKKRRIRDEVDMAMAAYTAEAHGVAQRQAQAETSVPLLERQLEEARREDRAASDWKPGYGDSPITAKTQEQLLQARQAAAARVPQILEGSVDFQRVQTAYKLFREQSSR